MHHRQIILAALTLTYYGLATYALAAFDAGLLVTAVVLFGVPALLLAHFTLAPAAVISSVALLGVGIGSIFEGVAHMYGLWYSLGVSELRLFGLMPLETIAAIALHVIFMVLLYEVLFDDGAYTARSAHERYVFFAAFGIAAWGLIVLHQFLRGGVFLEHSYVWLVGGLFGAALIMLMLHRTVSLPIIDRIFDFSLIAAVPAGLSVWLAAANVHKVYAFDAAYIGTVTIFGQSLPFEEMLLVLVLPFFIGVTYELYLDDRT